MVDAFWTVRRHKCPGQYDVISHCQMNPTTEHPPCPTRCWNSSPTNQGHHRALLVKGFVSSVQALTTSPLAPFAPQGNVELAEKAFALLKWDPHGARNGHL
eukprot:9479549-Pyramimonas_sp.AAC.1